MPATVIAERIGWTRSLTMLKDRVGQLRPFFLPPDPPDRRFGAAESLRLQYVGGTLRQVLPKACFRRHGVTGEQCSDDF